MTGEGCVFVWGRSICMCVCVSLCLKIRALEQRIKRSASHNKAEKKERQMDRWRDV